MSRPEIPIDWDLVDRCLEAGCNGVQIAGTFGMNPETFYDRVFKKYSIGFSQYCAERKQKGEALLMLSQYEKAIGKTKKGDTTLLTYLGKVRLKQKEPENVIPIDEEVLKRFDAMMEQIEGYQSSALNKEESNIMSEQKS